MISPRLKREGIVSKPVILVVEDDPVVALDLEHLLHNAGFYVVGPAFSVSAAHRLLSHTEPDAAVLDFAVGGEAATSIAKELADKSIPFVLASGSSDAYNAAEFASVENIGKPVNGRHLVERLQGLFPDDH